MNTVTPNYGDGPRAIYENLKRQIISGKLVPGDELRIMSLAKKLDVSIVPVREAIRMLAAENLVELRPRRSPIIARLDERDLIEMNQIRGALEPIVLRDAVARHTSDTIATCRTLLERDNTSTDLWEKVELNKEFHLAILGPSILQRSISIIADQYDGIARVTQYQVVNHGGMVGQNNYEHKEILDAAISGDADKAVELMGRHIDKATVRARIELTKDDPEGVVSDQDQPLNNASS